MNMMKKNSRIYVSGHTGLLGSSLVRTLQNDGYTHIISRSHNELELKNQHDVNQFFKDQRPEYVFHAAAKVGGINANITDGATFIYDNLMINTNVIHAAYQCKVKKLLFLGSSAIYPKSCEHPIKETSLLAGPIEQSHEPYAIAKIAGIKLCETYNRFYGTNFISCIVTNLYGPHDNFNEKTSHVIPALIQKIYKANHHKEKSVTIWGSGNAYREFLYVDDLTKACILLMNNDNTKEKISIGTINIGSSIDITIRKLAELIKKTIGYNGTLIFDAHKPEGALRRLLSCEKIQSMGWKPAYSLEDGIKKTVDWYAQYYKEYERNE